MSNKKLITQHRRGTLEEWNLTSEIPKDGELIVEKGTIPKIKIGNGNADYSQLPYITDSIENKVDDVSRIVNNELADRLILIDNGELPDGISVEQAVAGLASEVAAARPEPNEDGTPRSLNDRFDIIEEDIKDFVGKSAVNGLEYNKEQDYMLYLTSNGNRVGEGVKVIGGGGGPGANSLSIRFQEGHTSNIVILKQTPEYYVPFIFEGYDSSGDEIASISGEWKVGTTVVAYQEVLFGLNSFNIKPFIETTTQNVTLTVTDPLGNSITKTWTIQELELKIKAVTDDLTPKPFNKVLTFDYEPTGARDKILHVEIDGNPLTLSSEEANLGATISGFNRSFNIPAKYMKHGNHRVKIYLETLINNKPVYSEPDDTKDILVLDEQEESAKAVIGLNKTHVTIKQYESFQIRYTVYQPKVNYPEVNIYVNDQLVKNQVLEESHTDYYTFTSTEIKQHKVTIECGLVKRDILINVEKLSTPLEPIGGCAFDFRPIGKSNSDIDRLWTDENNPDIKMEVSSNFDWVNGGYTYDKDVDGNNIPGSDHFLVKAGTSATIQYHLFGSDISETGKEVKIIFKTSQVANTSTTCIGCMANNIGLEMSPHNAIIRDSVDSLNLSYSDEDIIEFEFNIAKANDSVDMIMGYEDGVATKALPMALGSNFEQSDKQYITIGCADCDVHIYRFKVYERALSDRDILNNFIADARTPDEIRARHTRNQIFNENGKLTPESLAKACPGLRVYKLSAPYFTNDKDEDVHDTTITQLVYREDGTEDPDNTWICTGADHSGQGTSSNDYGKAGRNLDFKMNVPGAKITLFNGQEVSKIQLSPTSVPTNYLNMKVNIASSNNITNALLAKLYNEYGKKIYSRPLIREEGYKYDIKDTMEFHNAVVFVQETDLLQDVNGVFSNHREFNDTNYHFYAIGNIGDSKKTDSSRLNDPSDPYEYCLEIVDVGKPLSDFPVDTMYAACTEKKDKDTGKITYEWLPNLTVDILYEKQPNGLYVLTTDTEIDYNAQDKYYVDMLEYDPINKKYTYDWRYCSNKKDSNITKVCKRAWIQFYRFVTQSSDADFKEKFNDYMIKDSALFNYLFTLRYCMVDNRAKNTFWHFAKTGEFHVVENPHNDLLPIYYEADEVKEYILTSDTVINPEKTYYSQHAFDLTWDYDNDTALGLNNYGQQVYRYGLEEPDRDEFGEEIFRESDSTFYQRIRNLFQDDLVTLYGNSNLTTLWNPENLIALADKWQKEFPEALWRTDIERKYIRTYTQAFINQTGDKQFLTRMCNGKMKYHRRQWERNQARYMMSKFIPSKSSSRITMRLKGQSEGSVTEPNYTFKVKPYAYGYINISYDNDNSDAIYESTRVTDLSKEIAIYKPANVKTPDIINIYSPEALTSIGDLSAFYAETLTISDARHLTEVKLGDKTEGYFNSGFDTLDTQGTPLLESIDIQNLPSIGGALDLSSLIKLKTLKATGTALTEVGFAPGGNLSLVEFPETITKLEFSNLQYLYDSNIKVSSNKFNNVTSLKVVKCPNINIDALLERCTEKLVDVYLTNLDWDLTDYESGEVKAYFENTYGNYNSCYLQGTLKVNEIEASDYTWIKSTYPDITIKYNKLSCVVAFKSSSEELLYEVTRNKGPNTIIKVSDPVKEGLITAPTQDPTVEYTYEFIGWSTKKNADALPLENPLVNIEGYVIVYPVYKKQVREYTITFKTGEQTLYSIQLPALLDEDKYYPQFDYALVSDKSLLLDDENLGKVPKNINSKAPDHYDFVGWAPKLAPIESDATYEAVFVIARYDELTLDDIEYSYRNNSEITITKLTNEDKTIIKIPSVFNISGTSYTVAGIQPLKPSDVALEALDLSSTSITILPDGFYYNGETLQEIKLPETLTKLEFRCLAGTAITFIDIPATVRGSGAIGYVSLARCPNLQQVYIRTLEPDMNLFTHTNDYDIFSECNSLTDIYVGWGQKTSVNGTNKKWSAPDKAVIRYDANFD